MGWIWFLAIGAVAGWLAGQIARGRGFGVVKNIVVGVVGSLIGGFVAGVLGIHWYGLIGSLVIATAGAIGLLWLARFLKN